MADTTQPVAEPRRLTLRTALAWYVALPITGWIILIAWFTMYQISNDLERSLQEDVELVGRAIRTPLARALESDDIQKVTETLLSTMDIGRVYGVSVYGETGELIATAGDVNPDTVADHLQTRAAEGRHGDYQRVGGRRVYSYFLPLSDSGGRLVGLLQITRRQRDMERSLFERQIKALVVIVGGAIGLAVLAIWGHHRALQRHLDRLGQDMYRLQNGQRDHRAGITGPAEIVALAQALNDMLDSIDRAETEIADRRQREATLQERLARSEKLAALGQLAAGVAHELGTPLSTIDGHAQRLLRDTDLPTAYRDSLSRMRQEIERTGNIVRQLLEVGRTRSRPHHHCPADRPLRTALTIVGDRLRACEQTCELTIDPDIPAVVMDAGRVEQALGNLLSNASQASPAQCVLAASCQVVDGDTVAYTIDDCGPGIDPAVRERIFEPFFTTKAMGQGTGLGLTVVRSVAEEHGGQILVTPRDQGGCRFTLLLPVSETRRITR